jgi:diacylglycerol kinase
MKRLMASFKHAFRGIFEAIDSEPNFKIHLFATIFVVLAGFIFSIHSWEWVAIIGCICAVLGLELLNTSIETMMNHLHPERHDQVRRIKDLSAGAVLVMAIGSAIIGLVIFLPKLMVFISV